MKFEYGKKDKDSECVAFIDDVGELCIKGNEPDDVIWIGGMGVNYCERPRNSFKYQAERAVHRFYPGDSITITF